MPRVRILYPSSLHIPIPPVWWTRVVCFAIAITCFAWVTWTRIEEHLFQAAAEAAFVEELKLSTDPLPNPSQDNPPATARLRPKGRRAGRIAPMAKLEIARLNVSGWVQEGLDANTLRKGIGHSPRSARPGEPGNMILAAHRDTFFSGLRDARAGDMISLQTPTGVIHRYTVSDVLVVNPEEVWVMNASPGREMLTLITCYPFHFAGAAPQRLIVRARPASLAERNPKIAQY